jgi:hypothetical protein
MLTLKLHKVVVVALAAAALAGTGKAGIAWQTILSEDFSTNPSLRTDPNERWTYAGKQNGGGNDLIRWNDANGRVDAEWDQSNRYDDWDGVAGAPRNPYIIEPSKYSRPLGKTLTDNQTFKIGVKFRITSQTDTTEYYQLANVGLYNLSQMGDDRCMSDDWSGNSTLIKNGSDFVEFNYFIGNNSDWDFYPMTVATIGPHIEPGSSSTYVIGWLSDSNWHNSSMGADHWLPLNTDLYAEVTYFGAATDWTARRAQSAVYADANRTQLLSVNGVEQYYWTKAVPAGDHFTLTDAAVWNYVGSNWGGTNGTGSGSFDDLYVMQAVPEPASAMVLLGGLGILVSRRRRLKKTG